MHQPVLYIMTHDSIGLGEDGPTHQPVEHLAACRSIPNLLVMRPADGAETAVAYEAALSESHRPTVLVLTRQNVPELDRTKYGEAEGVRCGAYILWQPNPQFEIILMATGSEVEIALVAAEQLLTLGISPRVVSFPCWQLFEEQPRSYRERIFPAACPHRIAIEAGCEMGWHKYIGIDGTFIGMSTFGASGPYERLYQHFGITAGQVVAAARKMLGR